MLLAARDGVEEILRGHTIQMDRKTLQALSIEDLRTELMNVSGLVIVCMMPIRWEEI